MREGKKRGERPVQLPLLRRGKKGGMKVDPIGLFSGKENRKKKKGRVPSASVELKEGGGGGGTYKNPYRGN